MNFSLSRFFDRPADATLSTCDLEQIHLCGMIQKGSAMVIVDPASQLIIGSSTNIDSLFDMPVDTILGMPLDTLSREIAEQIDLPDDSGRITHEILDAQIEADGKVYDVIAHTHAGNRFIEFIQNDCPSAAVVRKRLRKCGSACSQIMAASTFEDATQIAADAVKDLTGLARVKIYKFLPDWSGATIAEARDDRMPSMLGLHFPDTDIPRQVRELMTIVPYRFVGSVSDDNIPIRAAPTHAGALDMTWVTSRAVSTMHTAYLRNIGARSAFSCSLMDKGKLWGLIACHHTEDHIVPSDSWSLAQEIATALMLRFDQSERTDTADMICRLRRLESDFAAELRRSSGEVSDVVKTLAPILQKFLRADGFAFQFGQEMHTSGDTPPEDFIRELIRWTQETRTDSDQFQTLSLQSVYPNADQYKDVACGVLVQPIVVHRVCQLIWFRGPITRRVAWAGQPTQKIVTDTKTGATIGPRTSFEKWIEDHDDQSLPWEEAELQGAREIFQEFLDIISSQLLLKEENSSLRKFAHMAAHDIKAPLRGISHALEWMEEDEADLATAREHRQMAGQQARKLQRLTESLLELSVLREQTPDLRRTDLTDVLGEATDLLKFEIDQCDAVIEASPLPVMACAPDLMVRVFLNLIGNALKYARPDTAPHIRIFAQGDGKRLKIVVQDNGTGIDEQYAKRIFEPSQRLVHENEIEGCGFGLSICTQIAMLHNGRIFLDTSHEETGAKFVLEFPKVAA